MAKVELTNHLKRFFPTLGPQTLPASTVAELLRALDGRYPGILGYLVDERGSLPVPSSASCRKSKLSGLASIPVTQPDGRFWTSRR